MISQFLAAIALVAAADPAAELAAEIDRHVAERWAAAKVTPAAPADDAQFLRRVSLDLVGCVPRAAEVRAFLADTDPQKRRKLVDRLLASPAFARHRASQWRTDWIPQASDSVAEPFTRWIERRLQEGVAYNQLVREMLTAAPRNEPGAADGSSEALGFLLASDYQPENLAAHSARLFLGLNLECAQCHNHPFARWTNEQFWEFAAFFSNVQRPDQFGPTSIEVPSLKKTVGARFPDGAEPDWQPKQSPRGRLVDWMDGEQNRYFARNAVNRLWADLFGTGLVEPLDDLSGAVEPSHPELLELLSRTLVTSGYDIRLLTRAITASQAYQLTSAGSSADQPEAQLFARMALRPLSPEQLLASLTRAAGLGPISDEERHEFIEQFRLVDRRAEQETSILQTLLRMNGQLVAKASDPRDGGTLAAVCSEFLPEGQKIDVLYLCALSRLPRDEERQQFNDYVAHAPRREEGLADVLWVLFNSAEFKVNH